MQLPPHGQAWHEPAARKRVCRRHPKRLLVAIPLDGGNRNGKRLEPAANSREEPRSRVRQRQGARPAAEQGAPAIAFQQPDLMADRGGRHAQLRRGLLETQMPGGGVKRAELDEGRQLLHVPTVDEIGSSSAEFFAFAPGTAGRGRHDGLHSRRARHVVDRIRRQRRGRACRNLRRTTPEACGRGLRGCQEGPQRTGRQAAGIDRQMPRRGRRGGCRQSHPQAWPRGCGSRRRPQRGRTRDHRWRA